MSGQKSRLPLFLEPVAFSLDIDRCGVMENPVQNGTGDDRVSKDLSPVGIGLARGEDHRAFFIPSGDQLEKQVGPKLVNRDIADFVDDQCFVLGPLLELFLQCE